MSRGQTEATRVQMPFGKHRGEALDAIPSTYLQWLASLDDLREPLKGAMISELLGGWHRPERVAHHRICEEATMSSKQSSTTTKRILLAAVTFLLLSGPLSAHANIIYNWTGDCQRVTQGSPASCSHASLQVVTTDAYVLGTTLLWSPAEQTNPTLLEFRYTDDNLTTDVLALGWLAHGFLLMLPAGQAQDGHLNNINQVFDSDSQGTWHMASELLDPGCNGDNNGANPYCGYGTAGINGVWTRVPAPSTLVLLGVGLVGLVFHRRRS